MELIPIPDRFQFFHRFQFLHKHSANQTPPKFAENKHVQPAHKIFGKLELIPPETALPWLQTGVIPPAGAYNYWADPFTLFVMEMAFMGLAKHRRFQHWYSLRSMGKRVCRFGQPSIPGRPIF